MKNQSYLITYNDIPFSGYTPNGSQAIFNKSPFVFTQKTKAINTCNKLEVTIKSMDDIIGLKDVEFPFKLKVEEIIM